MIKEKLFKLLFPRKFNYINILEKKNDFLEVINEHKPQTRPLIDLDFSNVDDSAKPPHFLKEMTEDARKNFIADMETIFTDERFQIVVSYVINMLANHSFQVEPDENKMRNGRYAVIGIRTLMKELENMHNEFQDLKKKPDDFDPLETIPE